MSNPIDNTDKMSDIVYIIGNNAVLKFNTGFAKVVGGKRNFYYNEFEYPVEGLENIKSLTTIRRNFDYYLSIENIVKPTNGSEKAFIRIGPSEYFLIKNNLEKIIEWFNSPKYSNLFATYNGKLIITTPTPECKIKRLPMGKYIEFVPYIIDRGIANVDKEPGVRMYLSSPDNYCDMNLDRIMGLYYSVMSFNMYLSASNMLNYVGRPEPGTNKVVLATGRTFKEVPEEKSNSIEGRFIKGSNSNNIEDLEK